ncbi:hypothetical protein R5R35_002781 [Gryllus longicercus]|uniref:Accessory gland protein n=1 Tax=Gryllus longicercus TaxID=2509291 RepID=A0AAN9VXS1_9ORTH
MDRMQRFAVAVAVACCVLLALSALTPAHAAAVHSKRAVANSSPSSEAPPKICHSSTPCGWAVYVPFTRRVDYFMKNTCDCPKGKMCLRTDDDLSVSAYVYRCRAPTHTTSTTEADQA